MLPTEDSLPAPAKLRRRSDTILAVRAAMATMAFAWSGFQSAEWVRKRFLLSGDAAALSEESLELSAEADRVEQRDSVFYVEWRLALQAGDREIAEVIDGLFREPLQRWVEAAPVAADGQPRVPPFDDPGYDANESRATAREMDAESDALDIESREASKAGARYGGIGVLFAAVLAAVGVGSRFDDPRTRRVLIVLAGALFVAGMVFLAFSPVSFSAPPALD